MVKSYLHETKTSKYASLCHCYTLVVMYRRRKFMKGGENNYDSKPNRVRKVTGDEAF